jgi:hypothetical protein
MHIEAVGEAGTRRAGDPSCCSRINKE